MVTGTVVASFATVSHNTPVPFQEMTSSDTPSSMNSGVHDDVMPQGRVVRLDRGWSTILLTSGDSVRVRNIGVEVAVGDEVNISSDMERVQSVNARRSALIRRASFEGARAQRQIVASNIDTVFLVHSLTSPPNERRLERELVLAFDSGANPVIILTKIDCVDSDAAKNVHNVLATVAMGVPIHMLSGITREGMDQLSGYISDGATIAVLGASGVGKSTLVNALVGHEAQEVGDVRESDQRGRHTTVAAQLVQLPSGGWLLDTPGLRAVNLWTSGHGIERAFKDVFDLSETCKFRDCKHSDEPGCAVQEAIENGSLPQIRLESMRRLVAEEASIEEEQRDREKSFDRRGSRRPAENRRRS